MVLENQSLSFCLCISAGPGNRSGCTYIRRREEEKRMRREREEDKKRGGLQAGEIEEEDIKKNKMVSVRAADIEN